jgi:hypothetical protein
LEILKRGKFWEDYTIIITGAVRETPPDGEKLRQGHQAEVADLSANSLYGFRFSQMEPTAVKYLYQPYQVGF